MGGRKAYEYTETFAFFEDAQGEMERRTAKGWRLLEMTCIGSDRAYRLVMDLPVDPAADPAR